MANVVENRKLVENAQSGGFERGGIFGFGQPFKQVYGFIAEISRSSAEKSRQAFDFGGVSRFQVGTKRA